MSTLKGFDAFGDSTVTNDAVDNIISFFDYGLIEKSGFVNVEIPASGSSSNSHKLSVVDDPRYTYGQVWEGFRSNWVWESGVGALVNTDDATPGVSGVYVSGDFVPVSDTGVYSHHIDHPRGRVVFDSAISTSAEVTCEFSYKYVSVTQANGLDWFKQFQKRSEASDDSDFVNNSGEWGTLADNRIQLPAIGIEFVNSRRLTPYQLGGGQYVFTDCIFHCVAEDDYTRNQLVDIVSLQNRAIFDTYDLDSIAESGDFPLDYRGVPVSGALTYPELVAQHKGSRIRFIDADLDAMYSLNSDVHVGSVKITVEQVVFGV